MKRNFIKFCLYTSLIVTIVSTIFIDKNNANDVIKMLTKIISVSEFIIIVYCKWGWKILFLNFFKVKNLNGVWECTLQYNYANENRVKVTNIIIKQDLFGIQINMTSDETASCSINASIEREHGIEYLIYTYKTETKLIYREQNRDQFGAAKLLIKDINTMEGEYWTNNRTIGTMKLTKKVKK